MKTNTDGTLCCSQPPRNTTSSQELSVLIAQRQERFNSYLKNSFVTPLAATLKQHDLKITANVLNGHIGAWLETVAHQRMHGTTGTNPQVLLEKERFALQPTRPIAPLTMGQE